MRITLDEKQAQVLSIALACFIADVKLNNESLEIKEEEWLNKWFDVAENWDVVNEDDSKHVETCVAILKKLNKEIK